MENKKIDFSKKAMKYVQVLSSWLLSVSQMYKASKNKKHCEFAYITQIDKSLKNPKHWLNASLYMYDLVLSILAGTGIKLDSFLLIPLSDTDKSTKIEEINLPYIQSEISTETPPAILLYPLNERQEYVYLEKLSSELQKQVYYREVLENGVYSRGISVINA